MKHPYLNRHDRCWLSLKRRGFTVKAEVFTESAIAKYVLLVAYKELRNTICKPIVNLLWKMLSMKK